MYLLRYSVTIEDGSRKPEENLKFKNFGRTYINDLY